MIIAPTDCMRAACPHAHSWPALSQRKAAGGVLGQGTILPHTQSLACSTCMTHVPWMLLLWGLLTVASALVQGTSTKPLP